METKITTTKQEIADAFAEWHRQYKKNPERFDNPLDITSTQYGQTCANRFCAILNRQAGSNEAKT